MFIIFFSATVPNYNAKVQLCPSCTTIRVCVMGSLSLLLEPPLCRFFPTLDQHSILGVYVLQNFKMLFINNAQAVPGKLSYC